jgi:hypothetical protein
LILPFQEVKQQNGEPVNQFPLLGLTHTLDFLGDILNIGGRQIAGPQQRSLLVRPSVEISIV